MGNYQVPQNTGNLVNLAKLKNLRERNIREFLEINNLEVKTESDGSSKVLSRDQENIVNKYS